MSITPRMLMTDANNNIIEHPHLLMMACRNGRFYVPKAEDLMPLPAESELFMLPGRNPLGFNPRTGKRETVSNAAVAAFAAPGHTLNAHPAYKERADAPILPLFAYGAVGYSKGKFWICSQKVDNDPRQIFNNISPEQIEEGCHYLLHNWPENRLINHIINNCVRKYACPAARNFALGRYEAPLPSSTSCNAHCLACISTTQNGGATTITPQCRMEFTPTPEELAEVMTIHASRERARPIFSFGQGCEGDPILQAPLLAQSIHIFRQQQSSRDDNATINCNTNASMPEAIPLLAESGLSSLRVSLNSSQPDLYHSYYRPSGYEFSDVVQSIRVARKAGVFVSLNLLFFPGITDTEEELEALIQLCGRNGVSMIQWRNLNVDPLWYHRHLFNKDKQNSNISHSMGLKIFMKKLHNTCPWLRYGYFNPWLGKKALLSAPDIS